MIKYNLKCKCKKVFESWFSSSKEYETLKKKNLINCIYCNSTSVNKSIMSPNLSTKSNKKFCGRTNGQPDGQADGQAAATLAAAADAATAASAGCKIATGEDPLIVKLAFLIHSDT